MAVTPCELCGGYGGFNPGTREAVSCMACGKASDGLVLVAVDDVVRPQIACEGQWRGLRLVESCPVCVPLAFEARPPDLPWVEVVYVCPACGSEYTAPGDCGRNEPFVCRETTVEALRPHDDAVDDMLRAFNGWPAHHPVTEAQHMDTTWLGLRRALAALIDPNGWKAASNWEQTYGASR